MQTFSFSDEFLTISRVQAVPKILSVNIRTSSLRVLIVLFDLEVNVLRSGKLQMFVNVFVFPVGNIVT